jgi:outer membrane protein assembly factor BamB
VNIADGKGLASIDTEAYVAASAALIGNHVFLGNYEGSFFSADLDSEQIIWKHKPSDSPILTSPAVTIDRVIYGSDDKNLYCLNIADGKEIWKFPTAGEIQSSPVICGDKVLFGSLDGRIYLLQMSDGKEVWSYEIGSPISASPAIASGFLLIPAEDGTLYAFSGKPNASQ